jgi:hypothetical protein
MSNWNTIGQVSGGLAGSNPARFTASTPDSLATITASAYLDDMGDQVKANDIFEINYLDTSTFPNGGVTGGEAATYGEFTAKVVAGHMNLVQGSGSTYGNASNVNGLTAHAGGGQTNATPLTAAINRVTVVATAADSVLLPNATPGSSVTAINAATNSMNVYPAVGQFINALAVNTPLAVAGGASTTFRCAVAGTWNT